MLQSMRENASSWIIKVLLLLIVIAFVFMGLGSYQAQKASKVAMVNGDKISIDAYRNTYNNLLQQARRQFGGNLNDELLKMLNLKSRAVEQLITKALVLQEARKLNLMVSDQELSRTIQEMAVFQNNQTFSAGAYNRLLKRVGISPEQFEHDQREQMLVSKFKDLIYKTIHVSEEEARQWFEWEKASVNIQAVAFDPAAYKDIKTTEEAIRDYYDKNKENYKTDPTVKVKYVSFAPKAYRKDVQVSQEEIQEYYDDNLDTYKVPRQVEARHILIKADLNAPEEQVKDAQKEADAIYQKAIAPKADFAALAEKYSQGPSKDKGGYLGKFVKEAMVKPFAEKAFSMKPGEISQPVRTRFGWHIIKVENVFEARTKPLTEVEKEIRENLSLDKARNLAYEEAESFFDAVLDGDDLSAEAESRERPLLETDYFTRKEGPKAQVGDRIHFAEAAFELPNSEVSDILELEGTYYLLQVIDKIPQKIQAFEAVSDQVEKDLLKQLREQKAADAAEALLKALSTENRLQNQAEKTKQKVITTGFFDRKGSIPKIGSEKTVSEAAFLLSKDTLWPKAVVKGRTRYYVIEFIARKKPDSKDFAGEKERIVTLLSQKKQRDAFEAWLSSARTASEITIEEGFRF